MGLPSSIRPYHVCRLVSVGPDNWKSLPVPKWTNHLSKWVSPDTVFLVAVMRAVMGWAFPLPSLAVNNGLPDKAIFQFSGSASDRSNFQTLPFRSPAYAVVTLPAVSKTSPGVARPLSPATAVSSLLSNSPVFSLKT
ncbi:hypothetical protein FQZ97_1112910 [compost metagenome]